VIAGCVYQFHHARPNAGAAAGTLWLLSDEAEKRLEAARVELAAAGFKDPGRTHRPHVNEGPPCQRPFVFYSRHRTLYARQMHFAYIDESGDSGIGGSRTYSLGCILIDADDWPDRFNRLIDFRRHLYSLFGLPVRAEIKANYLIRNSGPFRKLRLGEQARFAIYRQAMRLHPKLGFKTFAILVNKANHPTRTADALAWEYLLQRLERFTTYDNEVVLVVHDEGNALAVRKLARKSRRAGIAGSMFGTGYLTRPFNRLLDDPVSRTSGQSYFVQLADLVAYAAFRRHYPPPARPVQIVPQMMWSELGSAAYGEVNKYSGGPAGIVQV
jgi:hypothetical protein